MGQRTDTAEAPKHRGTRSSGSPDCGTLSLEARQHAGRRRRASRVRSVGDGGAGAVTTEGAESYADLQDRVARLERELARSVAEVEALSEIGEAVNSTLDLQA